MALGTSRSQQEVGPGQISQLDCLSVWGPAVTEWADCGIESFACLSDLSGRSGR